jgi:hypothetical protein
MHETLVPATVSESLDGIPGIEAIDVQFNQ